MGFCCLIMVLCLVFCVFWIVCYGVVFVGFWGWRLWGVLLWSLRLVWGGLNLQMLLLGVGFGGVCVVGFDLVVLSGDAVGCVADLGGFGDFLVIWVLGLLRVLAACVVIWML